MPHVVSFVKAFVGEQKIVTVVILVTSDLPTYSVRAQKRQAHAFSFLRVTNQERQRQSQNQALKINFLRFLPLISGEKYKDF